MISPASTWWVGATSMETRVRAPRVTILSSPRSFIWITPTGPRTAGSTPERKEKPIWTSAISCSTVELMPIAFPICCNRDTAHRKNPTADCQPQKVYYCVASGRIAARGRIGASRRALAKGKGGGQLRRPPPGSQTAVYLGRLSITRTALPSLRAMVRGSLSFTCTWMLSTL